MKMKNASFRPDKKQVSVCGLFCPACIVFISQGESREKVAEMLRLPPEAVKCDGCRADNRFSYCDTCKFTPCASEKGLEFCGQCEEYPCEGLKEFQAALPHRIELWQAHARIGEAGYEKWFEEMLGHYSCPRCGTINSAYHMACRECGAEPSCAYVGLHNERIKAHPLSKALRLTER
jgi:hypothetical protein